MQTSTGYKTYESALVQRFWKYTSEQAPLGLERTQGGGMRNARPPVFTEEHALDNVLHAPGLSHDQIQAVDAAIPPRKRHRWFGSMKSSQALAQTVFGNLVALGRIDLLAQIPMDHGKTIGDFCGAPKNIRLEHSASGLGEHPQRSTEIDALVECDRGWLAIECKLTEPEVGKCSRPKLKADEPLHCDGSYTVQSPRASRCSLTEEGIQYWEHIPSTFQWEAERDYAACPVRLNYQLVRNLIAVEVMAKPPAETGTVILLVDDRNPAFQNGGDGDNSFMATRQGLRIPARLQRVTWQAAVSVLHEDPATKALARALRAKYGF